MRKMTGLKKFVTGFTTICSLGGGVAGADDGLVNKVKEFLNGNGQVREEFYMGHNIFTCPYGIAYERRYNLNGNVLVERYLLTPVTFFGEDYAVTPLAKRPVVYSFGGVRYSDDATDGINGNEKPVVQSEEPPQKSREPAQKSRTVL